MKRNPELLSSDQGRPEGIYLELLSSVARLAASGQGAEAIANGILGEMRRCSPFDRILLSVMDSARLEIVVRAQAGSGPSDFASSTSVENPPGVKGDAESALSLPLTSGETFLGVLQVERAGGPFRPEEVLALSTCAAMLASGLQNALLGERLQRCLNHDELTGINNRRYFLDALQREWQVSSRSGRPFSIVFVSLGGLNGHAAKLDRLQRDLLLARLAHILAQRCRRSNLLARYEEAALSLLMPETRAEQAQALADRLRIWLRNDPVLREHGARATLSVATYPLDGSTPEQLLDYAAKRHSLALDPDLFRIPPAAASRR